MPSASDSTAQAANPFALQAVQDPHDVLDIVDVATIHEGARRALERSCSRVRHGRSQVTVILGVPGSGKSHLLWWMRRQLLADGLVVALGPLPDLAQPFRHALRQLMSALCRKESAGGDAAGVPKAFERPIDRLLWEVLLLQTCDLLDAARVGMYQGPAALLKLVGSLCMDAGRPRSLVDFAAAAIPVWSQVEPGLRAYLLSLPTENSIDSAARAVVLQYPYADRRALCTAWLAGEELSPRDRERIGAKQSINNEAVARYVLSALSRLATARLGGPLAMVYDQADVVAEQLGQPGLLGVAEIIAALQAQGGSLLQVLSCRPETWNLLHEKQARPGPGQAGPQLKQIDDTLKLDAPAAPALRELIASRLSALSAAVRSSLPLSDGDLDLARWPADAVTPRAALAHFAARLSPGGPQAVHTAVTAPVAAPAKGAKDVPEKAAKPTKDSKDGGDAKDSRPVATVPAPATRSAPVKTVAAPKDAPAKPAAPAGKKDAPSAPGLAPTPPAGTVPLRDAGSKPGVADAAGKSGSQAPVGATKSTAPAKPPVAAGQSGAALKPVAAATSRRDAPSIPPVTVAVKEAPVADSVLTSAAPPSAQSPSVTWMAMAGDDDPLAAAIAEAEAELKVTKAPAKAPAKPAAAAKPSPSSPARAAAKPVVTINKAALQKAESAKAAPLPPQSDSDGDVTMMQSVAPSGQSPSVTWMAMAGGDDLLAAAIADAEADLGIQKPAAKKTAPTPAPEPKPAAKAAAASTAKPAAAKAAASAQSPSAAWMSMGSSDDVLMSAMGRSDGAGGRGGRTTQGKLAQVQAKKADGLTAEEVLSTLGSRTTVEEAQLAQELGVPVSALATALSKLEDRGAVRVVSMAGGKRVVSKL